jgi:CheY-like chemotaxis protein
LSCAGSNAAALRWSRPAVARDDGANAANAASLLGKRVLLVEDEPLVAMMMSQLLKDYGAEVIGPLSNLDDAPSILSYALDAAVLDVNLEGELVYPLADQLAGRQIPLVFVTGYEAERVEPRFSSSPILAKPIEPTALADALALVLATESARREAMVG